MMDPLLFSLFWVFGWAALLVIVWYIRGLRRQRRMELVHEERMAAMQKGVPLPELPDYTEEQRSLLADAVTSLRLNPRWPLGVGALSILLGVGTSLALRLSGDDYHRQIWSSGLIGVFFGLGLILHYLLTRPRS
jgi:hypothetical protein